MEFSTHLFDRFTQLSQPLEPLPTEAQAVLQTLDDIEVIAYDFYGTLFISGVGDIGIDDGKINKRLMLEALVHSNIEITSDDCGMRSFEHYKEVVDKEMERMKSQGIEYPEPDIRTIWKSVTDRLFEEKLISNQATEEQIQLLSIEFEARMNPVWPMPGSDELLTHFKEQGKLQGIISNSQFYTPIVLQALLNRSFNQLGFDIRLLQWSFETQNKKPGLSLFQGFLDKLNKVDPSIRADQVLYIGNDMLKDIYPAAKVGMKTALFAGDKRSLKWRKDDARCKDLEPDLVITDLMQLVTVVN